MADVRLGSVSVDFRARNAQFLQNLRRNRGALRQQRSAFRGLGAQLNITNRVMGSFVAAAGAAASIAGARAFVQPFLGFQETMAAVQAVTGATEVEFNALSDAATRLARTTRFTLQETGNAIRNLGTAGFSTAEILETLEPTLRLAEVGQLNIAEASGIAAGAIRGFQLQAADTERVVDVMATALASSNTNLQQLGDAFREAGPASVGLNVELEETTAVLSALANNMLQGARGGTAFRSVMARLANPVGESRKELEAFGLTAADVDVSQRGLIPVLRTIQDAVDRGASVWRIFGAEMGVAGSIMLANIDYIEGQTRALENAGGAAERMAMIMNDTAINSIREASSAWNVLRKEIVGATGTGEAIEIVFDSIAASLNFITRNIDAFSSGIQRAARPVRAIVQLVNRLHASVVAVNVFITTLNDNLERVEYTFAQVAQTAAIEFAGRLVRGFLLLPDLLLRPIIAAGIAIVTAFREAGRRAWEGFWDGVRSVFRPGDVERLVGRREVIIRRLANPDIDPETYQLLSDSLTSLDALINDLTRDTEQFEGTIRGAAIRASREFLADDSFLEPLRRQADEFQRDLFERLGLTQIVDSFGDAGGDAAQSFYDNFTSEYLRFPEIAPPSVLAPAAAPSAPVVLDTTPVPAGARAEQGAGDLGSSVERAASAAQILAEHLSEYERQLADAYAQATLSTAEYERQRFIQDGINRLLREGVELTEEELAATRELIGERYDALAPLQEAITTQEQIRELTGNMRDAFAQFGRDVLINFDSIGDAAAALGRRIYSELIERLIIQPFIGALFPSLPAGQHGGFFGPGLALVGEAGPEIVDFNRPARVYTNEELQGAVRGQGGGQTYNFAPVVQSADPASVQAAVRSLYPEWLALTKADIAQDGARPSVLRYAMTGR